MYARIIKALEAAFADEITLVQHDPEAVEGLVHDVGRAKLQDTERQLAELRTRREVPEPHVQPARLYTGLDGTTVHKEDGWYKAKVGCIYWQNAFFEQWRRNAL